MGIALTPRRMVLIQAQLSFWPDTIIMGPQELIRGVLERHALPSISPESAHKYSVHIRNFVEAYMRDEPDCLCYSVIDGHGDTCYGIRYGVDRSAYLSF